MRPHLFLGTAALLAAVAGCGGAGGPETTARHSRAGAPPASTASADTTPSPTSAPPGEETGRGRVITTADSDYGTMLFDGSGQAIYLFDKETRSTPRCYGACAQAWPPVLTRDLPRAVGDVRQSLLGTTRRRDGSRQITYGGHPLYFYAHEGKNEVLCHNVAEFGGLWLVLTPAGRPAPA